MDPPNPPPEPPPNPLQEQQPQYHQQQQPQPVHVIPNPTEEAPVAYPPQNQAPPPAPVGQQQNVYQPPSPSFAPPPNIVSVDGPANGQNGSSGGQQRNSPSQTLARTKGSAQKLTNQGRDSPMFKNYS
jgi:hypothetical protein